MHPLLLWFAVAAALYVAWMVFALTLGFLRACVWGFRFDPHLPAFESIDIDNIPGPIWDILTRLDSEVEPLALTHLGYMRFVVPGIESYSSVWCDAEGRIATYSTAARKGVRRVGSRAARAALSSNVTCSSTLTDESRIRTIAPYAPRDRRLMLGGDLSLPEWIPAPAIYEIHTARLARAPVPVKPFNATLEHLLEENDEFMRTIHEPIIKHLIVGPNGRVRSTPRTWAREVHNQLVAPIVFAFRKTARARRELRDLGLSHLWRKPK